MKNVWAILIWGIIVFAVGTFLDKVRSMLMSGGNPMVINIFRFAAGFVLVVIVVLVRRGLRKWMKGEGLGPAGWFTAGAVAWVMQAVYVRFVAPRRTVDIQIHDTLFVLGYWHLAVGVAVLFLAISALYYSYPVVTRRTLKSSFGYVHFWVSFAALFVVFWLENFFYSTLAGIWVNPQFVQESDWAYRSMAILLLVAQGLFVFNMVYSLFRKRRRGRPGKSRATGR
jgi:cytochrome c oxidase subunit I